MNDNVTAAPFWIVWNLRRGFPTFRHATSHEAIEEAKRLAEINPGQEFLVLATTHRVQREEPVKVTRLAGEDDILPF